MNAKPGGCQPVMHDTVWNGRPQKMTKSVLVRGHRTVIPRGLIEVLTERGCYRPEMKVDEMQATIASHADFKSEKNKLEKFLCSHGHCCQFA